MPFVRAKLIKGHTYYYLVENKRVRGKVKQKVVQYLGKRSDRSATLAKKA